MALTYERLGNLKIEEKSDEVFSMKQKWLSKAKPIRCNMALIFFLLFAYSVLGIPKTIWAIGNIHFGRIEINPGFSIKETYNNDVDTSDPDIGEDLITSLSAGLQIKWPLRRHLLQADWSFSSPYHKKYGDQWDYKQYKLATMGQFLFGRGGKNFELELNHSYIQSSDAPELGENRQKRQEHHFTPKLKVNIKDNLRLDLSYNYREYTYEEDVDDTHKQDGFLFSMNIRLMPKTSAFIAGQYRKINYEEDDSRNNSNDSAIGALSMGIHWEATAKLAGQISGGYQKKVYESNQRDRIYTWTVMVDLVHRMSDDTKITLGIDRGEREYSYGDYINNYTLNKIQVTYQHQLTYKIGTSLGYTYEYDDYQGKIPVDELDEERENNRNDTIKVIDFGLKYQIQEWFSTDLNYTYKYRGSKGYEYFTEHDYDYTNQIISVSLGLLF